MNRLAILAVVLATLVAPANAGAASFFLFGRASASPNDRVTIRTGGTPKDFTVSRRVKPFQPAIRLYLVRADLADQVHSRFEARLNFVGRIVPDRNFHGLTMFSVPPLDAGSYTIAYWCPGCAAYSGGRTFFVQDPDEWVPHYRAQALLRVTTTKACPVTLPNQNRPPGQPRSMSWYGNGLLWAGISSTGTYAAPPSQVGADGSIGNKLLWVTTPPWRKPTISGERLDAPGKLRVLGVNTGSFSNVDRPSHMSPVLFPTAGCWRLTARLGDVSLTYVVSVVVQ